MTIKWEAFEDLSYFNMWCVRPEGEKRWGAGFHLNSREEAIGLRDILNSLEQAKEGLKEAAKGLAMIHLGLLDASRPRQSVGEVCETFLGRAQEALKKSEFPD